jgi:hypothetical protein
MKTKETLIALAAFAALGGVIYIMVKDLKKQKDQNLGANA